MFSIKIDGKLYGEFSSKKEAEDFLVTLGYQKVILSNIYPYWKIKNDDKEVYAEVVPFTKPEDVSLIPRKTSS